jgi:hypothetical protein
VLLNASDVISNTSTSRIQHHITSGKVADKKTNAVLAEGVLENEVSQSTNLESVLLAENIPIVKLNPVIFRYVHYEL